jgi:Ca-activated chloride channel family protein
VEKMKRTVKFKALSVVYLLFAGSLFSCSGAAGTLLIMEGNFLSSRQRYNDAIVSYHKALDHEQAAAYAQAGLGAVYSSLGENKAALERIGDSQELLASFPSAEHRELRYRNSYNSGVALFAQGDFSAAAENFRQALRIDSGRIEAKRNLELSLLSVTREKNGKGQVEKIQEETERETVLFEYFKQKEQDLWKSREWAAEEQDTGPDY